MTEELVGHLTAMMEKHHQAQVAKDVAILHGRALLAQLDAQEGLPESADLAAQIALFREALEKVPQALAILRSDADV